MPTYEYECPSCGVFDFQQKIADPALSICPHCGSAVERRISGSVNFLFKGAGFYATEYRSEDYKKKAAAEAKGETKADSKSESKAETKTETKAETKTEAKTEGGNKAGAAATPAQPKAEKKAD